MAKSKKSENIYREIRDKLGLSREEASELLETVPPERLERIENEKFPIQPEEVCIMAKKYKEPSLCNYYCSHECPIGKMYVPEVKIKALSEIVLQMIASLNSMKKSKSALLK